MIESKKVVNEGIRGYAPLASVCYFAVRTSAGLCPAGHCRAERSLARTVDFREVEPFLHRDGIAIHTRCGGDQCGGFADDAVGSALWKASVEGWRFPETRGASLGDIISQNFFADFLLASAFHEDTRYVRRGP